MTTTVSPSQTGHRAGGTSLLARWAQCIVNRARLVLVVALLAFVAAGAGSITVFANLGTQGFDDHSSDSSRATALVDRDFGGRADLVFLVHAQDQDIASAASIAGGKELTRRISQNSSLTSITSYFETPAPALRSKNGADALVLARLTGPEKTKEERTSEILDEYNDLDQGGVSVLVGGAAGSDLGRATAADIALAETIAIPLVLILLVFVFGSIVAALLPMAVALLAMVGSFALLNGLTQLTDVSVFAINMVTALGLGLGVDYALLFISRYREALRDGATTREAVVTTTATAGRTIAFSAVTVLFALSAMLVFPPYFLKSFAYAGIAVVALAALAALVVLPALLVVLGSKVDAGRMPWRRRAAATATNDGPSRWGSLAAGVMRRPLLVMAPILALLALLATPLLGLEAGNPDDRVLPVSAPAHQVGDALRSGFAADAAGTLDIVTTAGSADQVSDLAQRVSSIDGVGQVNADTGSWVSGKPVEPAPGTTRPDATPPASGAHRLQALLTVDPASDAAQSIVHQVRALPMAGAGEVLVGGTTAVLIDNTSAITDHLWKALLIILVSTFVLLFLFTGSIVHPLRAVIGNVLTLAATLGVMVWIFQNGNLSSVLGFTPTPLNLSMLVLSVCVAFGLSMDYEVFLLGRIKEAHDRGVDSNQAVVIGVSRTGQIITSCAVLLAISFFAFVAGSVSLIQLFGLATGLAILIDATLVRVVLIPASMKLLGEGAWYAPAVLRRLHQRVGISE